MPNFKIVQLSDAHLGFTYAGLGPKAITRQQENWQTFCKIIEACQQYQVRFLAIVGDLFDTPTVTPQLVHQVQQQLAQLTATEVIITPGNHDPAYPGSYWEQGWPSHCHILTHWQTLSFPKEDLQISGGGFTSPYSPDSFFQPVVRQQALALAFVHGDLLTSHHESPYNPITLQQLAQSGYDWVGLGHIHTYSGIQTQGRTTYAYAGTPEGHGFDEEGPKGILVGTVEQQQLTWKFYQTSQRQYENVQLDVTGTTNYQQVVSSIRQQLQQRFGDHYARHLYRLTLTGQVADPQLIPLSAISAGLSEVFYHVLRSRVTLAVDFAKIAQEPNIAGLMIKQLLQQAQNATSTEQDAYQLALSLGWQAFEHEVKFDEDY